MDGFVKLPKVITFVWKVPTVRNVAVRCQYFVQNPLLVRGPDTVHYTHIHSRNDIFKAIVPNLPTQCYLKPVTVCL